MKDYDLVSQLVQFAASAESKGFRDVGLHWRMMAVRVVTGRDIDIRPDGERSQPIPSYDPKRLGAWFFGELPEVEGSSDFLVNFNAVVDALARIGTPPPDPEDEAKRLKVAALKAEMAALDEVIKKNLAETRRIVSASDRKQHDVLVNGAYCGVGMFLLILWLGGGFGIGLMFGFPAFLFGAIAYKALDMV